MPFPVAAALALGGTAASTAGGMFSGRANRRLTRQENENNRNFAREMWEKENAYNAPSAQMERLKAGGLNPNLVYGNGATTTSATAKVPSSQPLENNDAQVLGNSIQQGIATYVDLRQQKLQNDLLQVQIANQAQDVASKAKYQDAQKQAELEKVQTGTYVDNITGRLRSVGLNNAQALSDISVQHASKVLTQLDNSTEGQKLDNAKKAVELETLSEKNKLIVQDLISRIENNKANKSRTQVETELQKMRANLRKDGIETSDSLIFRVLANMFGGNTDGKVYNNAMDLIKGKK